MAALNKVNDFVENLAHGVFNFSTDQLTVALVELANGTLNKTYKIVCAVTFSSGLVAERTIRLTIKEK